MIIAFVVDTSPSMGLPLNPAGSKATGASGMSKLDLAKMAVEEVVRGRNKRINEHNTFLQQHQELHQSFQNVGLGYASPDEYILLSSGRQHIQQPATAACGAGGRLLVGYSDASEQAAGMAKDASNSSQSNSDCFQKELKRLESTLWEPGMIHAKTKKPIPFPEDGGGAMGLSTALSSGLQLLSKHRLQQRSTENYGMGRLTSPVSFNPSGGPSSHALQPACVIVLTDGRCLASPSAPGGGNLELHFGNAPLREFYQEPFRWDQRVFCVGVGGNEGMTSTELLHPQLRTLCEVTGGIHAMLQSCSSLSHDIGALLHAISPPRPKNLPIPDPLRQSVRHNSSAGSTGGSFVSGGPICSFQALEQQQNAPGQAPSKHRAMLLYVPHEQSQPRNSKVQPQHYYEPPLYCIPESYFPKRNLDTLPPRSSQPNLVFSTYPSRLGSKSFQAEMLLKQLNHLDQLVLMNRRAQNHQGNQSIKLLTRDVYICNWISVDGNAEKRPDIDSDTDYFPVMVVGAGRTALSEGEDNFFNIGIVHIRSSSNTLDHSSSAGDAMSTLTLLPPEPHILLPLLITAAEAEHRALKKSGIDGKDLPSPALLKKHMIVSRNVHLDEHWRNEFKAYMFRLPPYSTAAVKRAMRNVLPASANALLNMDGTEGSLVAQSFSNVCLQKIRNAEQIAREANERLEHHERVLRRRGQSPLLSDQRDNDILQKKGIQGVNKSQPVDAGYGNFDAQSSSESFFAAIRNLPAPWRLDSVMNNEKTDPQKQQPKYNALSCLGDLPAGGLMAYYESRRRWIFGGTGMSTRGLFVEGTNNDGSNSQRFSQNSTELDESILSLAGVGVCTLNQTSTAKMGDYRERLLWSRAPVVGYGSNDSMGVSATTSITGAPVWSVDDDAMPAAFFNPTTCEFVDSLQTRVRSRLMVNFGNPYKDKRADSMIPEKYKDQCPSSKQTNSSEEVKPPGSPPHDSYSAAEGEGEAVFADSITRKSPIHKSPSAPEEQTNQRRPPPPPKQTGTDASQLPHGSTQPPVSSAKSRKPPPPPQPRKVSGKTGPHHHARPPPPNPKSSPFSAKRKFEGTKSSTESPPAPPLPPQKPAKKERPNEPQHSQNLKQTASDNKQPATSESDTLDLQRADKKPEVNLPPGWLCVWSKSQKRWYFFDTKSNKSVWQWPPPSA